MLMLSHSLFKRKAFDQCRSMICIRILRNISSTSTFDFKNLSCTYHNLESINRLQVLNDTIAPSSQYLLEELNMHKGSVTFSMKLREDIISLTYSNKSQPIKALDNMLKNYLGSVFTPDALELKRITYETSSGNILESVARGEAVHSVRSLSELKRRLHNGRRCFAYFHHSLPNNPLAFIHVALTTSLAPSLSHINTNSTEENPTHAMFYSVNSPFIALGGLDLPTKLIKDVVNEIKLLFPSIKTFSTLSPIPNFMEWLKDAASKGDTKLPSSIESKLIDDIAKYSLKPIEGSVIAWIANMLNDPLWSIRQNEVLVMKDAVLWLGCHYIAKEKLSTRDKSLPLDPVARFHLRNGSVFHSINWMGNPSTNGLKSSASMMVNYVYDLEQLEANAKDFQDNGSISLSYMTNKLLHLN